MAKKRKREPMVTRLVRETVVNVLGMNKVTKQTYESQVVLPGRYDRGKKLEIAVHQVFDTEKDMVILIGSVTEIKTLYGITLEQFLEQAIQLDSKTRKPITQ